MRSIEISHLVSPPSFITSLRVGRIGKSMLHIFHLKILSPSFFTIAVLSELYVINYWWTPGNKFATILVYLWATMYDSTFGYG